MNESLWYTCSVRISANKEIRNETCPKRRNIWYLNVILWRSILFGTFQCNSSFVIASLARENTSKCAQIEVTFCIELLWGNDVKPNARGDTFVISQTLMVELIVKAIKAHKDWIAFCIRYLFGQRNKSTSSFIPVMFR